MAFEERQLRESKLLVVLSGLGPSRQSHLRAYVKRVFLEAEHPKEGEPHESLKGMNFTDSYGTTRENFDLAFSGLTQLGYIEIVGSGYDYLIHTSLVRRAEELKEEELISPEHYDYLQSLGRRIEDIAW